MPDKQAILTPEIPCISLRRGWLAKSARRRLGALCILAAAIVLLLGQLPAYVTRPATAQPDNATLLSLSVAVLGLVLIRVATGTLTAFAGIYGLYLTLAHLGAVAALLVEPSAADAYGFSARWLMAGALPAAVALSGLGIGVYALGVTAISLWRPHRAWGEDLREMSDAPTYFIGLTLLALVILYLVAVVGAGALPLLSGHGDYVAAIAQLPGYGFMLLALATGISFCVASGNARGVRLALGVFALLGAFFFFSGNRGEVLYPAAAVIAILRRRGYRARMGHIILGGAIFFIAIPTIRRVRATPGGQISPRDISLSWSDPLVEIGFTLRPLVNTVDWIRAGEPLAGGRTYIITLERLLWRPLPFFQRPRLKGTRYSIAERLPGRGYSVIAEGYFNFGLAGVLCTMFVLGLVPAVLWDRARSVQALAGAGAIMATLVNNVRNSFAFVPGHIAIILMLLLLATVMRRIQGAGRLGYATTLPRLAGE